MNRIIFTALLFLAFECSAQSVPNYQNYVYLNLSNPEQERSNLIPRGSETRLILAHDVIEASCIRQRPGDVPYRIALLVKDPLSDSVINIVSENQNQQPYKVGSKIQVNDVIWRLSGSSWRVRNFSLPITKIGSNFIVAADNVNSKEPVGTVFPVGGAGAGRAIILSSELKIVCTPTPQ